MTTKQKLFGLTIAGVTLFTVYKITEYVAEKKYAETATPNHPHTENTEEEKNIVEKVADKCKEDAKEIAHKVMDSKAAKHLKQAGEKMMKFIMSHEDEIRSLKEVIGFVAAVYTLKGAIGRSKMPKTPIKSPNVVKQWIEPDKNGNLYEHTLYEDKSISGFIKDLYDAESGAVYNKVMGDKCLKYETVGVDQMPGGVNA